MSSCMCNHLQKIKRDHQKVASCKRALYQEFLKCEVKTWETVINALEKSGEINIAEEVKTKLQKNVQVASCFQN